MDFRISEFEFPVYPHWVFMKDLSKEPLKFASLVAHQLKAPVTAVSTIIDALLGEYAGPLSKKQRRLLERAYLRCSESIETARRLMAIAKVTSDPSALEGLADLSNSVNKAAKEHAADIDKYNIAFTSDIKTEVAFVYGLQDIFTEVISALLSNALKYTPDNGRVVLTLTEDDTGENYLISISDSGIGIAKDNRDKIFEPFYRTPSAKSTSTPGTGLGLFFVRTMVENVKGNISISTSPFGGAKFTISLPIVEKPLTEETHGVDKMSKPLKVVIELNRCAVVWLHSPCSPQHNMTFL